MKAKIRYFWKQKKRETPGPYILKCYTSVVIPCYTPL